MGQEMFHFVISFVDWFDFEIIYLYYFEIKKTLAYQPRESCDSYNPLTG